MTDTVTTTTAPEPVNMSREYRAELKALVKKARALNRTMASLERSTKADIRRVEKDAERECARIFREAEKQAKNVETELAAVTNRRLILAGRLGK